MDVSTISTEVYSMASFNSNTVESVYAAYSERQVLSAVSFVAAVVGFFGNLAVITAILLVKKLQTTTNVFVFNLAVADILTCSVAPLQALTILYDDLVIPSWLCKLCGFCLLVCIGCSINNLACIAVNRLVRITTLTLYHELYTPFKVSLMVIISWCVPLAVAIIPLLTDHYAEYGFNAIHKSCLWNSNLSYKLTYAMLVAMLLFPLQFTVLFASYLRIYMYVRRKTQSMLQFRDTGASGSRTFQRQLWQRQVAVTKNLFLVVCVFVLSMIPYFGTLGLSTDVANSLLSYAAVILLANSSLNPIIYGTRHPDFKKAFARILCYKRRIRQPRTVTTKSGQHRATIETIAARVSQDTV